MSVLQIENTSERDNDLSAADVEMSSSDPIIESTTTGVAPTFSNRNQLLPLIAKPSGNMLKLKCPAKGDPEPRVEWTKDNERIDRKMGSVNYARWSITLEDLIPDDSGMYKCNVCNIHGCINYTTRVEVKGE
jgi:hypothetical protein